MARMFLDQAGISYETLLAEENPELCATYGVKEAPTLILLGGESAQKIANPSNIKAYVDSLAVKA
jgi:ribonucleoside-triphosphate reductase